MTKMKKEALKLPDWTKLRFSNARKGEFCGSKCTSRFVEPDENYQAEFPFLLGVSGVIIGIDPGANFGITILGEGMQPEVLNGTMPKGEHYEYGIRAYQMGQELYRVYHQPSKGPKISIIEGASYGDRFGQVGLAEIRFGFYLGLYTAGADVTIVAPTSIRKAVFGSGKTQAMDVWACLNHNGADSLAIALYSLMKTPSV